MPVACRIREPFVDLLGVGPLLFLNRKTEKPKNRALRCRAITHLKVVEPLRFFASDSELALSPVDMGPILGALYDFLMRAKDDCKLFMDLKVDIFDAAEMPPAVRARYNDYKAGLLKQTGRTFDGKARPVVRKQPRAGCRVGAPRRGIAAE